MIGMTTNQSAKMENEKIEPEETPTAQENEPLVEDVSVESTISELNASRWSVVSFEKCLAGNLTYAEASEKIIELAAEKVSGLCIVTDEAAKRIKIEK